ncbi:histidine phosphotransferase family protein [Pararhodospirillum photometricum]|uniref:histidine phosphotransferase family protein n=1 Tax=Pararhodospirillum photometricum TaxID=1084 RepID=UPI00030F4530|nr:histidine phosphotransferase family protein [Pararhodospirillum photometricum]
MLIGLDQALMLCTRLCHDLAGPIGAVATGAELLAEETNEGVLDAEALALLSDSAHAASLRLRILRMATGVARGRQPALSEALPTLNALLALGKRRLATQPGLHDPGPVGVRLLVLALLTAADGWPQVPVLTLEQRDTGFVIDSGGETVLPPAWRDALTGTTDTLEPRTSLAWLAGTLARLATAQIRVAPAGTALIVDLPQGMPTP